MTLFDSFNKPSWQHRDPEVRKSAIEDIDENAVLLSLVRDDPDLEVRSIALTKVMDKPDLEALVQELPSPLQEQARKQLLEILLPARENLSSLTDDAALIQIAELSDDPELVDASMDQVRNTDTRMHSAINHPLAKIRIAAARGFEDSEALRELMSQTRHKDKSVYRLCKERLERIYEAERIETEQQSNISQLSEEARKLSAALDSPEYKSRFQVLQYRWDQLKEFAEPDLSQEIENDLKRCADRIDAIEQSARTEQEQQAQTAEAQQSFGDILAELSSIDLTELDLGDTGQIKAFAKSLDAIEDRWIAALRDARPNSDQTRECKNRLAEWRSIAQVSKRVANRKSQLELLHRNFETLEKADFMAHHKLLEKTEKQWVKLSWPEPHRAVVPEPVKQLEGLREQLQGRLVELKKQETKKLQQLEVAFAALRKELDESHFNNADRHHNKIKNLLRHLGPEHQDHFHGELRPLTARLHDIHDWQGFAIEPKKVDLCERMAALVGIDEPPDTLAAKIKALQAEWKTLGHISPRRDQALWKKFHAAAEEAYQPCKEAFSRQSALRKKNFRQRMALVEQLVDYDQRMNWPGTPDFESHAPGPDWRMVQKTLDTARSAFNQIQPVDGRGERKSRKAFQKICDQIYGHIKDEYERNIVLKEKLVEEAGSLLEVEDLSEAIGRAKDIQRDWKNVGITPRQVDRKLWKKLRSACDAVFGRLDEKRHAENAARKERADKAKQLARQERDRWPRLLDKLKACALKNEDAEAATELWEMEGPVPVGIDKQSLEAWWDAGSDEGVAEDTLREACIAMEVLVEVDSPAQDKEARMAYQMKRLLEGMGSAQANRQEQLIEQINEFIRIRPPAQWLERFCCGGKIIPRQNPVRD
ncbi:DUF349 domain-containing protein [Pseudomonadota bacterium]